LERKHQNQLSRSVGGGILRQIDVGIYWFHTQLLNFVNHCSGNMSILVLVLVPTDCTELRKLSYRARDQRPQWRRDREEKISLIGIQIKIKGCRWLTYILQELVRGPKSLEAPVMSQRPTNEYFRIKLTFHKISVGEPSSLLKDIIYNKYVNLHRTNFQNWKKKQTSSYFKTKHNVRSDSKLLSGFPWSIFFKSETTK
jgi:hypothetical protein